MQDFCFPFPALLMFWTSALATVFMYTKAQGYLLLLLFPTDKAESAISADKSEFISSQGSRCHPFSNGSELWGQKKKSYRRIKSFSAETKTHTRCSTQSVDEKALSVVLALFFAASVTSVSLLSVHSMSELLTTDGSVISDIYMTYVTSSAVILVSWRQFYAKKYFFCFSVSFHLCYYLYYWGMQYFA